MFSKSDEIFKQQHEKLDKNDAKFDQQHEELVNIRSETLHLSEDTQVPKETTNKFSYNSLETNWFLSPLKLYLLKLPLLLQASSRFWKIILGHRPQFRSILALLWSLY